MGVLGWGELERTRRMRLVSNVSCWQKSSIDVGLVKDVDYSCASPIFTHYSSESELIIGPFRGSAMYIDRRHDRCMLHSVWQRVELALK